MVLKSNGTRPTMMNGTFTMEEKNLAYLINLFGPGSLMQGNFKIDISTPITPEYVHNSIPSEYIGSFLTLLVGEAKFHGLKNIEEKMAAGFNIDVYDNDRIREFKEFIDNTKDPRKRRGFLDSFYAKAIHGDILIQDYSAREELSNLLNRNGFSKQAEEIVHPKFY